MADPYAELSPLELLALLASQNIDEPMVGQDVDKDGPLANTGNPDLLSFEIPKSKRTKIPKAKTHKVVANMADQCAFIESVQKAFQRERETYEAFVPLFTHALDTKGRDDSTMGRMVFLLLGHQQLLKELGNIFQNSVRLQSLLSTIPIDGDVVGPREQLLPPAEQPVELSALELLAHSASQNIDEPMVGQDVDKDGPLANTRNPDLLSFEIPKSKRTKIPKTKRKISPSMFLKMVKGRNEDIALNLMRVMMRVRDRKLSILEAQIEVSSLLYEHKDLLAIYIKMLG